jgi:hypothetical protein
MNESLKKLSVEIASEITAIMKSVPMQEFIAKTKDALVDDAGTFEVVISTNNVDRQGESVDQNGWDLTNYKANPVVLFGHDYYSLPVGVCDSIDLIDGKLIAKGRFAPMDANPFAQQIRKLYDAKILRATSVGFIVKESNGAIITKAELLEFSFVPVPANPYALSMRQVSEMGVDLAMLSTKGLEITVKEEETPAEEPKKEEEVPPAPAPEATVEETPEPVVVEEGEKEKGMIADALEGSTDAIRQAKWMNMEKVFNVLDALIDAYMHPLTNVEDFNGLVTEFAQIMTSISGEATSTDAVKNMIASRAKDLAEGKTISHYAKKEPTDPAEDPAEDADEAQQVGVIMAKLQADADTLIKTASTAVLAIVSDSADTTKTNKEIAVGPEGTEGDEGEENPEADPLEQRSNTDVLSDPDQLLKAWIDQRMILRAVATATTDALTTVNDRIRKSRGY